MDERTWVHRRADEFAWRVDPRWADLLLGPDGLRLQEWAAAGRLSVVKTSPYRVVYRVEIDETSVFIKHFLVPDLRTKLRQWFRRGKGRNECRRAFLLARQGVPTIRPLAIGEHRRFGFLLENYLVTEGLDNATTLQVFFEDDLPKRPEPERSRLRRRIAIAFGRLTSQLHQAGFIHIDFHPGNVLLRFRPEGPLLNLIDLDAVRHKPGLGWSAAMDNLALLDHYFWFRSSRSERYRFFDAYLEARRPRHPSPRDLLARIDHHTRDWADRLWRRWAKRGGRSNKYFQVSVTDDVWAVGPRADEGTDPMAPLMADPDAIFRADATRPIKDSKTTTVAETRIAGMAGNVPLIYKRFNVRRWFEPWLAAARPSRGWASWSAGHHLASRAVPTPANIAYLARRGPRWFPSFMRVLSEETYLVTAKVEGALTLQEHVLDLAKKTDEERRDLIDEMLYPLAHLITTLHLRTLSHRDLKSANILLERLDDESLRLYFIDLVGARLHRLLPWDRRVQNLSRLEISLRDTPGKTMTDDLRFLLLYEPRLFRNDFTWKLVWRAAEARGRAKQAQNERRGRPIS